MLICLIHLSLTSCADDIPSVCDRWHGLNIVANLKVKQKQTVKSTLIPPVWIEMHIIPTKRRSRLLAEDIFDYFLYLFCNIKSDLIFHLNQLKLIQMKYQVTRFTKCLSKDKFLLIIFFPHERTVWYMNQKLNQFLTIKRKTIVKSIWHLMRKNVNKRLLR